MIDVSIMMAGRMIKMEMIIMMPVRMIKMGITIMMAVMLVIVTRAPSCKSLFAKALPKPWADPVITTTRPLREHFKADQVRLSSHRTKAKI